MEQVSSLSELFAGNKSLSFIEMPGVVSTTFGQSTFATTLTVSRLFSIYEVDLEVQRAIVPQNLSKLMDYINLYLENGQGVYFPGIILSARGAGAYDSEQQAYKLQAIEKLYVVDGQHRLAAFKRLSEMLQSLMARAKDQREYEKMDEVASKLSKLYEFPLSTLIYLDINAHQERQLFSDINKLPRKIGGNLGVLREQRRFYHVLATQLVSNNDSVKKISVDSYTERGKSPEFLFSYHVLIEILVALFEGRMKAGARNNSYTFTEKDLEEHYTLASHYFEYLLKYLPEPNRDQLYWSENMQIALAIFFHAESTKTGKFNRYVLGRAVKILPFIDWNIIYAGNEGKRLSRRSQIAIASAFVQEFYNEQNIFLISDKEEVI